MPRVWNTARPGPPAHDFNVSTAEKRVEKLRYLHRNPVRRGLVQTPEQWRWSSFRTYALQEAGPVRINEWGTPKLKMMEPTSFPQ
jgi:putative transposase